MTSRRVHIIYLSLITLSLSGYFIPSKQTVSAVERSPSSVNSKMIGNLETVHVGENKDLEYFAKIDSGAESSSIHAKNISTFHRIENGRAVLYVEFETMDENLQKKVIVRPVVKIDDVKSALGSKQRYFIHEKVWIGDDAYFVQVNLADRSHLKRKFLVGKNVLDERYIIDTSSQMLASP